MVFKLDAPTETPRQLSQSVVQITELLGLYQAELARVLHLQCADIGQLSSGQMLLQPDTEAWEQALLFVRFYQALYERFDGNGVRMCHFLRADNNVLKGSPHLLIVDDNQIKKVLAYLEETEVLLNHQID